MSNQPNSNPTNTTPGTNNPRRFWCHQCQREIVPMMAPYPTCQRCQGDFVEEIEGDNDLRDFGDQNGGHESEEESEESTNALPGQNAQNDVLQILQTMLQTLVGPNVPLHVETESTTYNGGTTTTTTARITAGGTTFNDFNGDHRPNVFFYGPGMHPQNGQENTDGRTPLHHNFLQLLQRTFEGGQQNQNWMNFLNMVGDPRDYVWGPGGLDNIISQLMEQTERQPPPPATDEIINDLPKINISKKQVAEEQLNCPICKDEFNENETATCLPCGHTFHDDCIRPWLKMNGTCPVCRYSLVSQEEKNNDQNRNAGGPGNGNSNRSGNGGPDDNFNGNPPSSSSQSSARLNLPGSYPLTQQQNGQQNRQNEEQSHDIVHEPLD